MDFVALDVETANADMTSICQIGVASFSGASLVDEWSTLVDPETFFEPINVSIHGINADAVQGAPVFSEVAEEVRRRTNAKTVVTHTHFDRTAIFQAFQKIGAAPIDCNWLDTARVARRAWTEFESAGYGLANVCEKIGYEFNHHNALEDAKAAGQVLIAASQHTGLGIPEWASRVTQPINPERASGGKAIERQGNPSGPLFGEVIVFTGALQVTRAEAADLAARVGCDVAQSVTKKTTILCVGDQDVQRLAGHSRSSKHRKSEALIERGQAIRIIRETDFIQMVEMT